MGDFSALARNSSCHDRLFAKWSLRPAMAERCVTRIAGKPGDIQTIKIHARDISNIDLRELLSYIRLEHSDWFFTWRRTRWQGFWKLDRLKFNSFLSNDLGRSIEDMNNRSEMAILYFGFGFIDLVSWWHWWLFEKTCVRNFNRDRGVQTLWTNLQTHPNLNSETTSHMRLSFFLFLACAQSPSGHTVSCILFF